MSMNSTVPVAVLMPDRIWPKWLYGPLSRKVNLNPSLLLHSLGHQLALELIDFVFEIGGHRRSLAGS